MYLTILQDFLLKVLTNPTISGLFLSNIFVIFVIFYDTILFHRS